MKSNIVLTPIVAGVIIKKGKHYLLVQEKKKRAYGLWNFPAGKVEIGDTIPETAIREAREETGFRVKLVKTLGIWQEDTTEPAKHTFVA